MSRIRIDGIVRIANQVRQQLQLGIHPQEVEQFKTSVITSIQQIERLCAERNAQPLQLPARSRQAYEFLKTLDFNRLPLADANNAVPSPTLRLKNVVSQQRTIQHQLFHVARNGSDPRSLLSTLNRHTEQIEAICSQNRVTPAALAAPSRSTYGWMKFLTDDNNLQLHLGAIRRAIEIGETAIPAQQPGGRQIFVEFTNFSSLYKAKTTHNLTAVQMSEGFIQAGDDVLTAVMTVALLGKSAVMNQKIRNFGLSEEYSDVLLELDLIAEITAETAKGNCYDLDELFAGVNHKYFAGQMVKPRLIWSSTLTNRKFGHYEPVKDRVVMSLTLDDRRIPRFVVEFVLYHELLHKHHGAKWVNGKRMVHTPEFRLSERQFKHYQEAEAHLTTIAAQRL